MTESTEQDLQTQIDELKAELRAMRRASPPPAESSRRDLLKNLGLAAAGAVAGTVAAGGTAHAATGDGLILGEENQADATTVLHASGSGSVLQVLESGDDEPVGLGVFEAVANGAHKWAIGGVVTATPDGLGQDEFPMGVVGLVDIDVPGIGVVGSGTYGGGFQAPRAHLVLVPWSKRDDTVVHHAGEYYQDHDGLLACVGEGTPGTWRKVVGPTSAGSFHLAAPTVRIYDSRPGFAPLDVAKGKMANGVERTIDARYSQAVPASAAGATPTAALVNLTVTDTDSVSGFMTLFENGTDWPGTSSINWDATGRTIANTTVVALDASGKFTVRCGAAPGLGVHVVIDVLGYWL